MYAGSKFVVEFQLGPDPVIGKNEICRRRIGRMLSAADREEIRTIQNKVISSLRRPPKNYDILSVGEELRAWYLKEFESIDQPYGERDDIWFRYASKEDVDRWAKFLVTRLPDCLHQVEMWDARTHSC